LSDDIHVKLFLVYFEVVSVLLAGGFLEDLLISVHA
jgi:hypothetical protein